MWKESWKPQDTEVDEECIEKARSSKRKEGVEKSSKRVKREEEGVVWGEDSSGVAERLEQFLQLPMWEPS